MAASFEIDANAYIDNYKLGHIVIVKGKYTMPVIGDIIYMPAGLLESTSDFNDTYYQYINENAYVVNSGIPEAYHFIAQINDDTKMCSYINTTNIETDKSFIVAFVLTDNDYNFKANLSSYVSNPYRAYSTEQVDNMLDYGFFTYRYNVGQDKGRPFFAVGLETCDRVKIALAGYYSGEIWDGTACRITSTITFPQSIGIDTENQNNESGEGGGGGSFDTTSDNIDFPRLARITDS